MFYQRDMVIYDEGLNITPGVAVTKGSITIQGDVAAFWIVDSDPADSNTTLQPVAAYRMRQVESDKVTGTGSAIAAGDRLYHVVALNAVQNTVVGTIGTDSYFVGWAKEAATATAEKVLMNFDGTRYDQLA